MLVRIVSILLSCLLMLYACSDSEKKMTESERKQAEEISKNMMQKREKEISYKINLLSLKYDITSDKLIQELVETVRNSELENDLMYQIWQGGDRATELLDGIGRIKRDIEMISIAKLNSLSIEYAVPVNKLAALFFDYVVLKAIEDME